MHYLVYSFSSERLPSWKSRSLFSLIILFWIGLSKYLLVKSTENSVVLDLAAMMCAFTPNRHGLFWSVDFFKGGVDAERGFFLFLREGKMILGPETIRVEMGLHGFKLGEFFERGGGLFSLMTAVVIEYL